jgi:ankyrin repeat protein
MLHGYEGAPEFFGHFAVNPSMKLFGVLLLLLCGCASINIPEGDIFELIMENDVSGVKQWVKGKHNMEVRWNYNVLWLERPTPLQFASSRGNVAICDLLISHGARIEPLEDPIVSASLASALTVACAERKLEVAKFLIEKGANVDHQDERGFTALMFASFGGNPLSRLDPGGQAAQEVYEKQAEPFVRLLLEHKANTSLKTAANDTARGMAPASGFNKIVELIDAADSR